VPCWIFPSIFLKGKTQEIGYITYFAKLGVNPSVALKTRADIDGDVTGAPGKDLKDLNIKDNINPLSMGWHVGGGIEYSLGGTTSLIAELIFS